jgi:hypothetical protein
LLQNASKKPLWFVCKAVRFVYEPWLFFEPFVYHKITLRVSSLKHVL